MTKLALPQLTAPASAASWFDFLVATGTKLGIPATDWEAGAPTRTTFVVFSNAIMVQDVDASLIAQAGFLDYAAFGSVTYVDIDGNTVTIKVTPDPSNIIENPTGQLGALDVLADAVYDVQRILKSSAAGVLAILNTSASTYTYAAGAYHVARLGVGASAYANAASLTIAPSATIASVTGAASAGGIVKITTGGAHGLATGDVVYIVGVAGTTEANGAWPVTVIDATHVTLDGSVYAHAWTSGGTVYAPTLASFTADNAGTSSNASARAVAQAVTSIVGVSVSNPVAWAGQDTETNASLAARCRLKLGSLAVNGPASAYDFFALTAQAYASKLTPPLTGRPSVAITRSKTTADRTTGTVTTTIANSSGAPGGGAYPGSGDDGGDVWATGAVIQAWAVPWGTTSIVQAAANHTVNVAGSVWVPSAQVAAANIVIAAAVPAYFATLAIGGVSDPGGASNVVPLGGIEGALVAALKASAITAQDIALTLNGSAANVALSLSPVPEVAVLGTMTAASVGV